MSFLDLNKSFSAAIFKSEGLRSVISINFSLCPQTSPFGAYHCQPLMTVCLGVSHHASIPQYLIQPSVSTFEKSHPIKKNVPYQLWSVMKQGVIVFYDSSVRTDGAVSSGGPANGGNSKNFLLVLQQPATCLSSVG